MARRGVVLAAWTPRATGFVGQRLRIFKTLQLSDIVDVVFLFLKSPFRLFCVSSCPVSVQVIGALIDEDLCVKVDLEGMLFHDFVWVDPGLLISCCADALGVLGLRPGSGILCWGFCGLVVFEGCGWHVQVLWDVYS